jgi:superfamily II DNA or RNA helicase
MDLRDYQEECVSKMLSVSNGRYGIWLPPAAGKTVIMANYISRLPDKTFLILVNRDELVKQTIDKLNNYGIKSSIEKSESRSSDKDIEELNDRIMRKRQENEGKIEELDKQQVLLRQRTQEYEELIISRERKIFYKYQEDMIRYEERLEKIERTNAKKKKLAVERYIKKCRRIKDKNKEILKNGRNVRIARYQLHPKIRRGFVTIGNDLYSFWRFDKKREKKRIEDKEILAWFSKIQIRRGNGCLPRELCALIEAHCGHPWGIQKQPIPKINKPLLTRIPKPPEKGRAATYSFKKFLETKELTEKSLEYRKEYIRNTNLEAVKRSSIVVASIQSLHETRLYRWTPSCFDIVIMDEAHHIIAPTYQKVLDYFERDLFFGLSATFKGVNHGLDIAYHRSINQMMKEGWLSRPKQQLIDLTEERVVSGDPRHTRVLYELINEYKDKSTIVFCDSVEQANQLAKEIPFAVSVSALTEDKLRDQYLNDFKEGKVNTLLNYQIVYEGFDAPEAEVIIAKNTLNENVYIQSAGRGLRLKKNKSEVLIVDVVTRKNQCTMPSLLGLNPLWIFEDDDIIADYEKAKEFADKHKLNLEEYPNWGFLRLRKPMSAFNLSGTRRPKTPYKSTMGVEFKALKYNRTDATVAAMGGSNFYNPTNYFTSNMQQKIEFALKCSDVRNVDPSLMETRQVTDKENMRLKAVSKVKKHWQKDKFLKQMFYNMRRFPLSEKQCQVIFSIAKDIEEYEHQNMNEE